MGRKSKAFAAYGGLLTALYLCSSNLFPLPDFVMGFILGMAVVFFILALLPERILERLKRWKFHG